MSKGSQRSRRSRGEAGRSGGRGRGSERGRPGSSGKKAGRFDWSVADEEEEDDPRGRGSYDDDAEGEAWDDAEEDRGRGRRRRGVPRAAGRPKKKTLMDLCTPLFGYASMLPHDPSGGQPGYAPFRDQVLAALNRIQAEAPEHGIEVEDARQACYALSFFLDTQVAQSEWTGKAQWSAEPLGIVLQQDPEGGVNFFRRLDSFGERQKDVKEVFLVCLALGFRGKYAEQDAATQAAQIADVRQKIVRAIQPQPLDKQAELFPEAYREAEPIQDEVPPPPRWWWFASLGVVGVVLVIWVLLFVWAGRSPRAADETVVQELERVRDYRSPVARPAPAEADRPDTGPVPEESNGGPEEDGP